MTGMRNTRAAVRPFLPWSDTRHERWLTEQARSGWNVTRVHAWGYTLERGAPAEVAYRLDVAPRNRADADEYLALFRDAGWEHVGRRGLWEIFRKPVVAGEQTEIHTDPGSKIAVYQRAMAFLAAMTIIPVVIIVPQLAASAANPRSDAEPVLLALLAVVATMFVYGTVRLGLVINRLRKRQNAGG